MLLLLVVVIIVVVLCCGLEKRSSSRGRRRIDIKPSQHRAITSGPGDARENRMRWKLASKLSKLLSASSEQAEQAQKVGGPQRRGVADPDPGSRLRDGQEPYHQRRLK